MNGNGSPTKSLAEDHIARVEQLSSQRAYFEAAWRQVSDVAAPDAAQFETGLIFGSNKLQNNGGFGSSSQFPTATKRSKKIYDTTAINAIDRLASGIEALVIPQSEYWHGIGISDLTKINMTDDEKRWTESQRDLLFRVRYDADSGFVPAMQTAVRRCIQFGNGFIYVDEGWDNKAMIRYRYMPLNECYVAEDAYGQINTWYRVYSLTAKQAVSMFGDRVCATIKAAAAKPKEMDNKYTFIQCVYKREEYGSFSEGMLRAPFASVHIDLEGRDVVRESGYTTFPIIDFRWLPEPGKIYGEGPVMRVLSDIQSLNLMGRNELIASDIALKPPLLVANSGVMNRPNANPGAIIMGGIAPNGQKLVDTLHTQQRLDFFTNVLNAKQAQVKDSLYITLFQTLVRNPQQSATEALIRANEKAELLGPAGTRLQAGLSKMIDRELDILIKRGLYEPTSQYAIPRSLQGKKVNIEFTSPLDRMRRIKQVEGTQQLTNILAPLAANDPEIMDIIDTDEMARGSADILNVPIAFIRPQAKIEAIRQGRRDQAAQQAQSQNALQAAQAGKAGAEALQTLQQTQAA